MHNIHEIVLFIVHMERGKEGFFLPFHPTLRLVDACCYCTMDYLLVMPCFLSLNIIKIGLSCTEIYPIYE